MPPILTLQEGASVQISLGTILTHFFAVVWLGDKITYEIF